MDYKARELARNIELLSEGGQFHNRYSIEDGIVRWNSNNQVPPAEMVEAMVAYGEDINVEACKAARDADTAAFLAEYIEAQKNRTPEQIAEEAFEMRAAFGPGETVVNVFTGETFRT